MIALNLPDADNTEGRIDVALRVREERLIVVEGSAVPWLDGEEGWDKAG
jgi:hypothetical protein